MMAFLYQRSLITAALVSDWKKAYTGLEGTSAGRTLMRRPAGGCSVDRFLDRHVICVPGLQETGRTHEFSIVRFHVAVARGLAAAGSALDRARQIRFLGRQQRSRPAAARRADRSRQRGAQARRTFAFDLRAEQRSA